MAFRSSSVHAIARAMASGSSGAQTAPRPRPSTTPRSSGKSLATTGSPAATYSNSLLGSDRKYDSDTFWIRASPTSAPLAQRTTSSVGTAESRIGENLVEGGQARRLALEVERQAHALVLLAGIFFERLAKILVDSSLLRPAEHGRGAAKAFEIEGHEFR